MKPPVKKNYKTMKPSPKSAQRKAPPKSNKSDVSPKNEVKEMLLQWFRKHNSAGQVMSKQDVVKNILTKLDSKQEDAFSEAVNELKTYGFIETQEDGLSLVLTAKGSDFIK